jgi:predicted membrane-bound dolichyl-phosphate-mannose-protein mannosyltransferase
MHLAAGYSYLATRDFRLEPQNPPLIKELLALPIFLVYRLPFHPDAQQWRDANGYAIGHGLLYKSTIPADQILTWGRVPNLVLGALLVALGGWWAYRLWGEYAGLLAVALAFADPNLIAHSSLVTTDIGASLFVVLSVYLLWEFVSSPSWSLLIATGISTGAALLSEFYAIPLLLIIAVILGVVELMKDELLPFLWVRLKQPLSLRRLTQSAIAFVLICAVALLLVLPVYLFQGYRPWFFGLRRF